MAFERVPVSTMWPFALVAALVVMQASPAEAQHQASRGYIGLSPSANLVWMSTDRGSNRPPGATEELHYGDDVRFSLGGALFVGYAASQHISLELGLQYISKGGSHGFEAVDEEGATCGETEQLIRLDYLTLPLMAVYRFSVGSLNLQAVIGPEVGFLLDATAEYKIPASCGMDDLEHDFSDYCESVDLGISAGLRLRLPVGRLALQPALVYSRGILDIGEKWKMHTNSVQCAVAIIFPL